MNQVICYEDCSTSDIKELHVIKCENRVCSLLYKCCSRSKANQDTESAVIYAMTNGNLLKNWRNYTRIKNCRCDDCRSTNQLHTNARIQVYRIDCFIRNSPYESDEFVSQFYKKFVDFYLGLENRKTKF